MSEQKYMGKYRIKSARHPRWNYAWKGIYFITICTGNRECYFGNIRMLEGEIIHRLSEMGKIAHTHWQDIPNQFPFAKLETFVIMPNHVHGLIVIDDDRDAINRVSTSNNPISTSNNHISTSENPISVGGVTGNNNPMLHQNLSRIIRWYKGRCSYEIKKNHPRFSWQPRFHDHIVRDQRAFDNIQKYINNNPKKWACP